MKDPTSLTNELKILENSFEEINTIMNKKNLPMNNFNEEIRYLKFCIIRMRMEVDMCKGNFMKVDLNSVRIMKMEAENLIKKLKEKIVQFKDKA